MMLRKQSIIDRALDEDIGTGDLTSNSIIPKDYRITARIVAKEKGVIAGLPVVQRIYRGVQFHALVVDGDTVNKGAAIAEITGNARFILSRERTALNFIRHLSGIATMTRQYADELGGVTLLDTRKTTPGLRKLEKYAVRIAGGKNHRFGLYDMVLIKSAHIAIAGGITEAIQRARRAGTKIEVEVEWLEQVEEALRAQPDMIMLDNMPLADMKKAIKLIGGKIPIEVSGNVTLERLPVLCRLGIQYVSSGAITHSASALDLSMEVVHDSR